MKWIMRVTAVLLVAATFTWLDGIKAGYYYSSTTLTDLTTESVVCPRAKVPSRACARSHRRLTE